MDLLDIMKWLEFVFGWDLDSTSGSDSRYMTVGIFPKMESKGVVLDSLQG